MAVAILIVAGLIFAYIASWDLYRKEETMREESLVEQISKIEDKIDKHEHSISLLEEELETLLEELREIQEQEQLSEDRDWRQMKL